MHKISRNEVLAGDGSRVRVEQHVLSLIQGRRYLNVPIEHELNPPGIRVHLSQAGTWMEDGKPCEAEGTLNIQWLRSRLAAALKLMGHPHSFDR